MSLDFTATVGFPGREGGTRVTSRNDDTSGPRRRPVISSTSFMSRDFVPRHSSKQIDRQFLADVSNAP